MNCIVCSDDKYKTVLAKDGFELVKCENDGHIFLLNPPEIKELTKYYDKTYFKGKKGYRTNQTNQENNQKKISRAKRRAEKITQKSTGNRLLDVGCGLDIFLETINKHSWFDGFGVDISEYVKQGRKNVWIGDFNDYPAKGFDIITMFSYLEHTINPIKSLNTAYNKLKENGKLVISLPNINGLPCQIMGASWRGYSFPEHIHFFNKDNLYTILDRAGFEPIKPKFSENNFFRDTNYFYAKKK